MTWMVKPYSRRRLTREERIANYRIPRGRRGVENAFWNISEQIQGTTKHHGAKTEGCQRHCFTCVVLHNMLMRASPSANDIVTIQNKLVVYVPEDNYWNPTREPKKHQLDLLKDYFNHMGALAGQEDRI